jgi:hypothetical protein
VKALSVWNPWAWALVEGIKRHENRTWPLPRWIRGQRILIHCGQHKPTGEELAQIDWAAGELGVEVPAWARRPVGGFVGSLVFDDDVTAEQAGDLFATGPRCWQVQRGSAVMFRAAIPSQGAQGFFNVPAGVARRFIRRAS